MFNNFSAFIVVCALTASAQAQTAMPTPVPTPIPAPAPSTESGVTQSIDPAKAAEVEKAAQALKDRQAQEAQSGQPKSSASIVRSPVESAIAYLSGGVSVDDRLAMHAERDQYSLWVATVAAGSGAYLADAQLRITNTKTKAIALERTMDGPWLFVALPAGNYDISATLKADGEQNPQTLTTRINVPAKGQRQAVLRFKSTAMVSTDMDTPFKGNPFDKPTVLK